MKNRIINSTNDLMKINPIELATWLQENFANIEVPAKLDTTEELKTAGELLSTFTNAYSYIMSVAIFAGIIVRELKRQKANKNEIDDAIARRDILENYASIVKAQYAGISRMIAVKKQIDEEMKMV